MTGKLIRRTAIPHTSVRWHAVRRRGVTGALVLATLVGIPGCDNLKEANAKNFGQMIQQHLERQGEACLGIQTWPQKVKLDKS